MPASSFHSVRLMPSESAIINKFEKDPDMPVSVKQGIEHGSILYEPFRRINMSFYHASAAILHLPIMVR